MADEQKPTVEVPEAPKPDTTAAEQAVAVETAAAEDKPVEAPKPAEAAEAAETEAAKTDDKKDEAKPVDEGHLGHKAQGASFPKNLIPSKEFFFFGADAFEPKALAHYLKSEKSAEAAHSNIAWASHTGKGLLFIGYKKAPTSVIHLADASEPEVDGSTKFHFTSKGNKHSFKAASAAERDDWVAQLKLKITEAKELAATVAESETYKKTLETFKPVPAKEDEAAKADEPAKADDAPKYGEAAKDDSKATEEPKRRSGSRKRASFFNFGGKKDEHKAEEAAVAPEAAEAAAEAENAPAADAQAPAAEEEAAPSESPKEKVGPTKRNSFFGGVFSKKEKKLAEAPKPAEDVTEAPKEGEASVTDAAAPVIPPVESTMPLNVDVSNPATAPPENVEAGGAKSETKEAKEKRKSSLPFAFGKRDKSPSPVDGEEKPRKSAFSKLRATIKGKSASKSEEKTVEEAAKDGAAAEGASKETTSTEEASNAAAAEAGKAANTESENKPENVASVAPVVTAAA